MPIEKSCKKCGITKPASEFSVVKNSYNGVVKSYLNTACKPCIAAYNRSNYTPVPKSKRLTFVNSEKASALWKRSKLPFPKREKPSPRYIIDKWEEKWTAQVVSKEYPTCPNGHKYVGTHCLPCKYSHMSQAFIKSKEIVV